MSKSIIALLLEELAEEATITKNMLSRIPDDKYDWRPHPKSMNIRSLAGHLTELPYWVSMALNTDGLDFAANPYDEPKVSNTQDVLEQFERAYQDGKAHLEKATEEQLEEPWTLRNGEEIYFTTTRYGTIRTALSQIIHHRAQMGVFLRLLDIPIPGSYGPSADEKNF